MADETRYRIEWRKRPGDPWQEAEPHLPWHERFLETRRQAEWAISGLEEQGDVHAGEEFRIAEVSVDPDSWGL